MTNIESTDNRETEKPGDLGDSDYQLIDGGAWFTVGNVSIRIRSNWEGVWCEMYPLENETAKPIGYCCATWEDSEKAQIHHKAEQLGYYIGHDMHGWYVADESEREADETGNSVGFDGRPHYPTELKALEALQADGVSALKAD